MKTPVRKRPDVSPPRARTRVVVSPRPGEAEGPNPDRYADRTQLTRAATGPGLPDPDAGYRNVAEIEPAPPDPGPCPTCGQPRPNAINSFHTGNRGSVPLPAREADGPLDPDGELHHMVLDRLRECVPVADIARTLDVTPGQVLGVALAHGIPTEEAA